MLLDQELEKNKRVRAALTAFQELESFQICVGREPSPIKNLPKTCLGFSTALLLINRLTLNPVRSHIDIERNSPSADRKPGEVHKPHFPRAK